MEGHLCHLAGLDGFRRGRVAVLQVVHEVDALHGAPADAAGEALGHEPLGGAGAHVAAVRVVLQLRFQLLVALLPLLDFVHGDGEALVLVVAGLAGLGRLGDLRLSADLAEVLLGGAVQGAAAAGLVELLGDGEPVGHLDVAVAAQGRQHGWVVAIEVRVVAGAAELAQGAPLALQRHLHLRREAFAHQHGLVHQAVFSREARLALAGVLLVSAVLQRQARPVLRLGQVHVVLLQLASTSFSRKSRRHVGPSIVLPSALWYAGRLSAKVEVRYSGQSVSVCCRCCSHCSGSW